MCRAATSCSTDTYALISSGWNKRLQLKEGGAFSETAVWQEAVKGIDPEPPRRMRQTDWEQLRKIISFSIKERTEQLSEAVESLEIPINTGCRRE